MSEAWTPVHRYRAGRVGPDRPGPQGQEGKR